MKRKSKIIGRIFITSLKSGFVSSPDIDQDIFIPFQLLNGAFHGDKVEVLVFPKVYEERPTGEVLKIIERKKNKFVGTIKKKKGENFAFLLPDDSKSYFNIFISKTPKNIRNNDKALVQIVNWSSNKGNPMGKIIRIIGKKGDNEAEVESMVIEGGFEFSFSKKALNESLRIKNAHKENFNREISRRKDFRKKTTFTIDPEDAKDYDDAISIEEKKNGEWELGIHIADVSHYVKNNSILDLEAKKRTFSIYLPDRTIPMLPETLSADLCSLKPKNDRLCFSVVFNISSSGEINKRAWIGKSIINSDYRFNYKEVQDIVDGKIKGPFKRELKTIEVFTEKLKKERIKLGAIDIDQEEIEVKVDSNGKVLKIYSKKRYESHRMIEELMILANKTIASFFKKKDSFIFRIHEKPEKESLLGLLVFLKGLGYPVKIKNEIKSHDLNNILKIIKGKDEEFLVKSVLICSLPRAIYSTENKGHFALALKNYTHFTSPIRRYSDLMIHRLLEKKLRGENIKSEEIGNLKETAIHITNRENELVCLERASIAQKQTEYMLQNRSQIFKGIISSIAKWGIYIQELETKAEGMVRLKDMANDYYKIDNESFSIIGSRSGKKYSLGDKVKIRVVDGDIEKGILDYKLI